jgi:hypothetical protein
MPFKAPGIVHGSDIASCASNACHGSSVQNHRVSYKNAGSKPTISIPSIVSPVNSGNPSRVTATVIDGMMKIAAAQYQINNGSLVLDWTDMLAQDGSFDYWTETAIADIDTSSLSPGTYTVSVRGMSSGPRTNTLIPAYPWNGAYTDISSAVLTVTQPKGYVNGSVKDVSDNAIAGATVTANNGMSAITDSNGLYSLNLDYGPYQLTISKDPEYYPISGVNVMIGATQSTQNFILNLKPKGTISGTVRIK